ncbi:molybdate ABC transporter substrate-binding protein [uncultured Sulfitobacter sp.]|uniref:molybdate ABC transporter substrate-binding protein n=1 Tax=uncultured Sulfitobacter sp. TaxID=191468 RepID=UPI00262AE01F|nr:molybdate ABC transporter substrate-binding protein [uncultured Sulfitobacter sp.]
MGPDDAPAPLAAAPRLADSHPHMRTLIALLFAILTLPAQAQNVTVFAAASLRDALTEIIAEYPAEVTLSFAGSGTLARQIAAGAPADVVILAHRDWADWMADQDLILKETRTEVAGGQLVLIGGPNAALIPNPTAQTLNSALNSGRLAMGQRDGVPAGSYARQWLWHIGAWDAILPQIAETDNVRAALALVAQGAAPLGIVYASDAMAESRVKILYTIPSDTHAPIRYPAAAITEAGRPFLTHLTTPEATAVFTKYGLTP